MKTLLRVGLALILSSTISLGAWIHLVWDPNSEPDVGGYRMYYGTPEGTYTEVVDVGNVTNFVANLLVPGRTYNFYVTCYNTSGLESEPSNIVVYTVPVLPEERPASPGDLRLGL